MKALKLFGLLACLLLSVIKADAQKDADEYVLGQIGWTFSLPPDFTILSSTDMERVSDRGKKAVEKIVGQSVDVSATKVLVSAKKDNLNYFNCTVTAFDPAKDGNWNAANAEVKKIVYDAFKKEMPSNSIDSVTTKTTIDGVPFDKFTVTIVVRAARLKSILYSRLHRGYNLGITCTYADPAVGRDLQYMLDHSKFKKD